MEYVKLGNSDLEVSKVCLGCMGFGDAERSQYSWVLDEEKTRAIIKRALDEGINFFDTAPAYQDGTSAILLGKSLHDYAKREEVVIATNFVPRTADELEAHETVAEHIHKMLDGSLKRMGIEYIDLYYYHIDEKKAPESWDSTASLEEVLEVLEQLRKDGKIRYFGLSDCRADELRKANEIAKSRGISKIVAVKNLYNLIFREVEREISSLCEEEGVTLTPYAPLSGGRLARPRTSLKTKRRKEDESKQAHYRHIDMVDEQIVNRVQEVAGERGDSMAQVALAWLISKGAVPITGATRPEQVTNIAGAVDVQLKPKQIRLLEEPYAPHEDLETAREEAIEALDEDPA